MGSFIDFNPFDLYNVHYTIPLAEILNFTLRYDNKKIYTRSIEFVDDVNMSQDT